MSSNGIMEDIRNLLSEGKSSGEVIALGYKAPTVYKVQRQLRKISQGNGRVATPENAQLSATDADLKARSELEAENGRLSQEVVDLEGQLERILDGDVALKGEVQALQERVSALQTEANAACQLRQRVKDLEGRLEFSAHTDAGLRQKSIQWREKFESEQVIGQKAESQAAAARQDNLRLQGELEEWQQLAAKAYEGFQMVYAEAKALQPLKVWAGHPCVVCKQPMAGSVERETAFRLVKDLGHETCLEQQDSGLGGWLLAGGAALYGLSLLNKK